MAQVFPADTLRWCSVTVFVFLPVQLSAGQESLPTSHPAATQPCGDAEVNQLLSRLNSSDYTIRQQATFTLLDAGVADPTILRRILSLKPGPEVEMRIRLVAEMVFAQLNAPPGKKSGFLGIMMEPYVDPNDHQTTGVKIAAVLPLMSAERAGLEVGDVILATNGQPLPPESPTGGLQNVIQNTPPGQKIELLVLRDGKRLSITLAPIAKPMMYNSSPDGNAWYERFKTWYVQEIDPTATTDSLQQSALSSTLHPQPGQVIRILPQQGGVIEINGGGNVQIQGQAIIRVEGNFQNGVVVIQQVEPAASQPAEKPKP